MNPPLRTTLGALVTCGFVLALASPGLASPGLAAVVPAPFVGTAVSVTESTSRFAAVGPLRLADTREAVCGCSRLDAQTIRVVMAGRGGVPGGIAAASITVTATASDLAGFVTAFPAGEARSETSTLNLPVRADTSNSTIIAVGATGAIDLYASVGTELIVDVTGVFTSAATATAGRFVPTEPTRLLDTRDSSAGGVEPGAGVTLALPAGVAPDARAVAINVTSVGARGPGFLTGYPAGSLPPATSFMNPDGTGAPTAASIILPVSAQGFTIASSAGGHVLVDLVGWFTGEAGTDSSDGLLVVVSPTRLVDTRSNPPRLWGGGAREIPVPVAGAAVLVTNVTMANPDRPGFVTAYPAGTGRPATSSVNSPARNVIRPNLAITSLSTRGIVYFSSHGTDLIVDMTGYFTGNPVAATLPPPPNVAPVPRVLMIGDSSLGGLVDVPQAQSALRGFVPTLDAKPCRRLYQPSCTSRFTNIAPNTAVDAINAAAGPLDIVLIKTGYNDSAADFETAVSRVVSTARAKGARLVIWLTYSEGDRPGNYNTANAILQRLAGNAAYPDLAVADWRRYAANSSGWYATDRVHLLTAGVWATADFISRWVAHASHLPCPMPWTPGGVLDNPCPSPEDYAAATGSTPNLRGLYGF